MEILKSKNFILSLFKNSFGGLSRSVWILACVQLINRSGTMVLVFMTVYGRQQLHFSVEQVGIVMALFGLGSFTGVFISGKLVDKIGYYSVMVWSLASSGILFIVLGQLQSFVSVCTGTFLVSSLGEAFRPANMAAIGKYSSPETQTRSVSLNRLAINIGFTIGPALGGFLASRNYQLLFWADGITCIAAALAVKLFLENKPKIKLTKETKLSTDLIASPYKDKLFLVFCAFNVFYAIAFFQLFFTLPLFYKEVHHISEQGIGWLLAMNGILVATIEMVLIYKIEGRWSKMKFISFGTFILMLNYLLMPFANSIHWLIVGMLFVTISEMFAMPFMSSFMMERSNSSNRGQYSSLYSMSWSIAQITSPILASQIIARFNYNTLWYALAFMCLMISVGIRLLDKWK